MKTIYNIILSIPPVKCLSFGGGGARGSVYAQVMNYLEREGTNATVEEVLGVSAGAISAAFLAIGAHPSDLNVVAQQTNFKSVFKHWSIFKGGKGVFYTDEFKIIIEHHLKHFFQQRLQEAKTLCTENLASRPQAQQELLAQIQQLEQRNGLYSSHYNTDKELHRKKEHSRRIITFIDLHALRKIYTTLGQPNRIKSLTIVAVGAHNKKPHLFTSDPPQDICIVDAIVASSAIPPLFKPHVINKDGEDLSFIDGCFYNGLMNPSHQHAAFVTDMERRLQTLLFLLSPESEANTYIYNPLQKPAFLMVIVSLFLKFFIGVDFNESQSTMYKSLNDYGHNVVPMDVDLNPINFGLSLEKKVEIGLRAIACLQRYLSLRKQEGYYLRGTFVNCLYQVPLNQFHQAKEAILQQMESNNANNAQHSHLIDTILSHRVQQQKLEEPIREKTALLSSLINKNASELELDKDIEEFNRLFKHYCYLPKGIPDESQHIKKICEERFNNGTNHQLKAIQSYLQTHQIGTALVDSVVA